VVSDAAKMKAAALAVKVFSSASPHGKPIVGIFPEGTRSKDGEPLPAISGAAWIARRAGVPLIPVALCGFWEAWPPSSPLPRLDRRNLSIHFLEPVNPADFSDDQSATDFALNEIYTVVRRERAAAVNARTQ
jgi:1-acyl-sn-glycerol-3-phosphate acyltransferase